VWSDSKIRVIGDATAAEAMHACSAWSNFSCCWAPVEA
jgi:hypothetical protein